MRLPWNLDASFQDALLASGLNPFRTQDADIVEHAILIGASILGGTRTFGLRSDELFSFYLRGSLRG